MPKRRRPRVDDGDVHGDDCNDSSDQLKDGLTFRDRVCVELRDLQVRLFVCLFVSHLHEWLFACCAVVNKL